MRSSNRLKASIVDLTFITWALALPFALPMRALNADGDFPRHLAMGDFILRGGPWQMDTFSFARQAPFLTTEWLSQVVFALVHRAGGLAGISVLCGLLVGVTYALVLLRLRRSAVEAFLAFGVTMLAAVLGSPHWVARPHIFTFVALAVLFNVVAKPRAWWLYATLFAVWANLHGGFVLGLALLAALAVGDGVEARLCRPGPRRAEWTALARSHGVGLVAGVAGSLLNPVGPALLLRIRGILANGYMLDQTTEFQSIDFHTPYGKLALLVLLGLLAVSTLRERRLPFPHLFVVLMLLAGGLVARRNFPLFALFALPLLALDWDADWRALRVPGLVRVRRVFEEGESLARPGRWAPWFAAGMLLLGLAHGTVAGTTLIRADFDGGTFPVAAVRAARAEGVEGRIFTHEAWAGYMLHAWPGQRIFIDGMTDFFGVDLMKSYLVMMELEPGWEAEMDRWGITLVLLKPATRLAAALRARCDWTTSYEDGTAVLLVRDPSATGTDCR